MHLATHCHIPQAKVCTIFASQVSDLFILIRTRYKILYSLSRAPEGIFTYTLMQMDCNIQICNEQEEHVQ
jgi:hypothetical protein